MNKQFLHQQAWQPITIDHVHLSFLRAEWDKIPIENKNEFRKLIDAPELSNAAENEIRNHLLYSWRAPLLLRVPRGTRWFNVDYLTEHHLDQLHVIGSCGWDSTEDNNELEKVSRRNPMILENDPEVWHSPILWGHTENGPFTILEGNHRLIAYASSTHRKPLRVPVHIGLCPLPCIWHLPDSRPVPKQTL